MKLELETVSNNGNLTEAQALAKIRELWFKEWKDKPASYLLGINTSSKIIKGSRQAITGILYLSPNSQSGVNICPHASAGCIKDCLNDSGKLWVETVANQASGKPTARLLRTWQYLADRKSFNEKLDRDVKRLQRIGRKKHRKIAIRLNGTSDLVWTDTINRYPKIQFYDYTKDINRYISWLQGRLPSNYHLTFSASEDDDIGALFPYLRNYSRDGKTTIAVPFNPIAYKNILKDDYFIDNHGEYIPIIDGDKTDNRFLDPGIGLIALKAKGTKWKSNCTGFVRDYLTSSGLIV